MLVHSAAER
jgi:hypothetical protein